jgi:nucleotide-binding universal stress UspA family protein
VRFLVPVSLDPSSAAAGRLAAETARTIHAEVRFLYVVDRVGIHRTTDSGALPAMIRIAQISEEETAERLAEEGKKAVTDLCRVCKELGVLYTGELKTGAPREEIENSLAGHDLVVAGMTSRYSFDRADEPGKLPFSLMHEHSVPFLLAASPYREVKTVVIGCGGGERTALAVGAMMRVGLWKAGCRIILLAVDESETEGDARLAGPRRILADSGYSGWEERVVPGERAEAFLGFCEQEGADAVVLGGWAAHRWHEFFGRSITGRILEAGRFHAFLSM